MLDLDQANPTPGAQDRDGAATRPTSSAPLSLLVCAAIGGAVALSLGVYGRTHTPTGESIFTLGFSSTIEMKAWLGTGAMALALVQAASAASMWGRFPDLGFGASTVATAHRWTGTAAFVLTLPIAYHCLWALGFQDTTTRVLVHSLLGCAFYGAMTTKLLLLRATNLPRFTLPIVGGSLVALLTGIWLTSSLWYFTTF